MKINDFVKSSSSSPEKKFEWHYPINAHYDLTRLHPAFEDWHQSTASRSRLHQGLWNQSSSQTDFLLDTPSDFHASSPRVRRCSVSRFSNPSNSLKADSERIEATGMSVLRRVL